MFDENEYKTKMSKTIDVFSRFGFVELEGKFKHLI